MMIFSNNFINPTNLMYEMNKNIKICYPRKEMIYSFQKEVVAEDIYQAVKIIEEERIERINFDKKKKNEKRENGENEIEENEVRLGSIINLHNKEGICCLERIRNMVSCIENGKDIFEDGKWPNIKLAQMKEGLILFDGHHSLLAYMIAGKKYLSEIPHILIFNCNDSEIKVVFGKLDGDWKKEVVNWQASAGNELCIRREKNMDELFTSLHADICLRNE
jgi:hypothetical protein